MPRFDSGGVEIDWEEWGRGPTILLVHGFASDRVGNWVTPGWIDTLTSAGRRVIALDCRGHGRSGKPHDPEAYGTDRMADDAIRLLDRLEQERVDLMGYSMGGMIAANLLSRHASRLRSAVLAGIGDGVLSVRNARRDPREIASALTDDRDDAANASPVARAFRQFAEQNPDNDLQALAACMRRPRSPLDVGALERARVPVLIAVGSDDTLALPIDRLAATLGAESVVLAGRDHLTAVADPLYKRAVVEFLAKHAS